MQQKSPQQIAQCRRFRKMLLIAPLAVVPFLALGFYALGGGRSATTTSTNQAGGHGINLTLPIPHFGRDKPMDKMSLYHLADLDSAKWRERMKQDPYYNYGTAKAPLSASPLTGDLHLNGTMHPATGGLSTLTLTPPSKTDSMASQVLERLEQLKKVIHQPQTPVAFDGRPLPPGYPSAIVPTALNLDQLQQRMPSIRHASDTAAPDPQMDRINAMLDKLIKIQHPEQADGTPIGESSTAGGRESLAVSTEHRDQAMTMLDGDRDNEEGNGFISIDGTDEADSVADNTIAAVINQDQTVVAGATVELRLTQDADVNGIHIPKDNLVYGQADLKGERLGIIITSIRNQNAIYPVSLSAYDLDGLAGIRIPGAISRDVSKESADQAINALGITSLDPTAAGQALNATIQGAKDLISRKVKLVRVSVRAGYQVLLKNTKVIHH
jgi:hypothetical protein